MGIGQAWEEQGHWLGIPKDLQVGALECGSIENGAIWAGGEVPSLVRPGPEQGWDVEQDGVGWDSHTTGF